MKKKTLKEIKSLLIIFVSQPQFDELIQDIESFDEDKRYEYAKSIINNTELQKRKLYNKDNIHISVKNQKDNSFAAGGWSVCVNLGPISICYAF